MEKIAIMLSENTTLWPEEIIREFLKKYPDIEKLGANVDVLEFDNVMRNMIALITIPQTDLGIYAVAINGDLQPIDLISKGSKVMPLNPDKMSKYLIQVGFGEGTGNFKKDSIIENQTGFQVEDAEGNDLGRTLSDPSNLVMGGGLLGKFGSKINQLEQNAKDSSGNITKGIVTQKATLKEDGVTKDVANIFKNLHKKTRDRMVTKEMDTKKVARFKIEQLIKESIMDNLTMPSAFKLAELLERNTDYRIAPETDVYSARYDHNRDAVVFKKACYAGLEYGEGYKIAEKEDAEEKVDEGKITEGQKEQAIVKGKDVPVSGTVRIIVIKKKNDFDAPDTSTPGGAVLNSVLGDILPGILRKVFGIGMLGGAGFGDDQLHERGIGFLGVGPGDKTIYESLNSDSVKCSPNDKAEDLVEGILGDKPTSGSKIVIVTKKQMSEPMTFLKDLGDSIEVVTKGNKNIKVKKDDKIKTAAFADDTLYVPEYKIACLDKDSIKKMFVKPMEKISAYEEVMSDCVDVTNEQEKEASGRKKIVIFIDKKKDGFYVSATYKDTGKSYAPKTYSSSSEDVGEELISYGVSPMRSKEIAKNLKHSDTTSFSIEADVISKDMDDFNAWKKASFILSNEQMNNLVKVAFGEFGEAGDYANMMRTFGSSVIDSSQIEKYKDLKPEIDSLKLELGEIALMKKVFGRQEETEDMIKAIEALETIENQL